MRLCISQTMKKYRKISSINGGNMNLSTQEWRIYMSLKDEIKKEAAVERQKLKNMSFQDKIWYIGEYYKFHIAVVVGIIFILCIIGTSIYNSTIENSLYCIIINNQSNGEVNYDVLTQEFHDHMGFGKKQEVHAESIYITYSDVVSEFSYASMAKISAMIASKELDILITDEENFERYSTMEGYADLEQALPEDLLGLIKDRLCYGVTEDGRTAAFAVDISGTEFTSKMGISLAPAYCGFISNSQNRDTAIALLRYIFEQ